MLALALHRPSGAEFQKAYGQFVASWPARGIKGQFVASKASSWHLGPVRGI